MVTGVWIEIRAKLRSFFGAATDSGVQGMVLDDEVRGHGL
jgi:hypothetical protein